MSKTLCTLTLAFFALFSCQKKNDIAMSQMQYFYRASCPYSKKVSHYIRENHIAVVWKNVRHKEFEKELVQSGGRRNVPCLVVQGQAIYGSSEIIDWMQEHVQTDSE